MDILTPQHFVNNGYGEHSPHGYGLMAALLIEVVLTAFFLMIIMGSTNKRAPAGFVLVAIGALCYCFVVEEK